MLLVAISWYGCNASPFYLHRSREILITKRRQPSSDFETQKRISLVMVLSVNFSQPVSQSFYKTRLLFCQHIILYYGVTPLGHHEVEVFFFCFTLLCSWIQVSFLVWFLMESQGGSLNRAILLIDSFFSNNVCSCRFFLKKTTDLTKKPE